MNVFNPMLNLRAILAFFSILYKQQELTREMTAGNSPGRYAGQALGVLWGFVHPAAVVLIYIFVFTFVFQSRVAPSEGGSIANNAVYLLAGLVPWMAIAEVLSKGTQVITNNANLVKQVIFPLGNPCRRKTVYGYLHQ